jgi:methylase of polypeptide subunit release factors
VACARENAQRLGLSERFTVEETNLFPEGRADLVLFNPPWLPEEPKSRVDRAVFDGGGKVLEGFLAGLAAHLEPGGLGLLILSDLGERLGLRAPGLLTQRLAAHGLTVAWSLAAQARHGKAKDAADPLHAARSAEVTTLYALTTAAGGGP